MKYMKAAEFKAKCLKVMEEVAATGEEIVVTKRGTPIVRVVPPPWTFVRGGPPPSPLPSPKFGGGAGADFYLGGGEDLVEPATDPDDWTGDEENLRGPSDREDVPSSPRDAREK